MKLINCCNHLIHEQKTKMCLTDQLLSYINQFLGYWHYLVFNYFTDSVTFKLFHQKIAKILILCVPAVLIVYILCVSSFTAGLVTSKSN